MNIVDIREIYFELCRKFVSLSREQKKEEADEYLKVVDEYLHFVRKFFNLEWNSEKLMFEEVKE